MWVFDKEWHGNLDRFGMRVAFSSFVFLAQRALSTLYFPSTMNPMRFGGSPGSLVTRPQTFDQYMPDYTPESDDALSHELLTRNQVWF